MSRLRGIKGKDAIKAFVKAGGIERRGKGDHVNVKMLNSQIVTLSGSNLRSLKLAGLKGLYRTIL